MNYVHGTLDLISIVGIEHVGKLHTHIDAAHGVHHNMRSHTGGACTFGVGVFGAMSSKQKLNTASSTESELVGNSDFVTKPIALALFMEAQGYPLSENVVHGDNMSTIKLLTNGRKSCGKRSRHVEIRHYFVKDFIDKGTITLKHCPTELMLADFFTKPLQGSLFKLFRDVILGLRLMSDTKHKEPSKQLGNSTSTPSKERVALNNNMKTKISFAIKASKDDGADVNVNKMSVPNEEPVAPRNLNMR